MHVFRKKKKHRRKLITKDPSSSVFQICISICTARCCNHPLQLGQSKHASSKVRTHPKIMDDIHNVQLDVVETIGEIDYVCSLANCTLYTHWEKNGSVIEMFARIRNNVHEAIFTALTFFETHNDVMIWHSTMLESILMETQSRTTD